MPLHGRVPGCRSHRAALVAFFGVAFGIMAFVGAALVAWDVVPRHPAYGALYATGLLSPFLGALAYARLATGSLRPVLALYWPLRLGPGGWMIVAVPLAVAFGYAVARAFGLPLDPALLPSAGSLLVAILAWSSIMWAEETGWRGVLLPVLQARIGPLPATAVVAAAWILWHAPMLHMLGMSAAEVGWFCAQCFGMSLVMTWAWNRPSTALVPVLIHGANNAKMIAFAGAAPGHGANDLMAVQASGVIALGLGTILATRGRLGLAS